MWGIWTPNINEPDRKADGYWYYGTIGPGRPLKLTCVYLAGESRMDGTYFTSNIHDAHPFATEAEADEKIAELVMLHGYMPTTLAARELPEPE